MSSDRDRLIELFEAVEKDPAITCPHYKTDKTCDTCKYTINNYLCNHTERTVDYLLANGVIVPQCNFKDTIYRVGSKGQIYGDWELMYIQVYPDEIIYIDDSDNYFTAENIGKTVFLTKEEAEEKLKEREGK